MSLATKFVGVLFLVFVICWLMMARAFRGYDAEIEHAFSGELVQIDNLSKRIEACMQTLKQIKLKNKLDKKVCQTTCSF